MEAGQRYCPVCSWVVQGNGYPDAGPSSPFVQANPDLGARLFVQAIRAEPLGKLASNTQGSLADQMLACWYMQILARMPAHLYGQIPAWTLAFFV